MKKILFCAACTALLLSSCIWTNNDTFHPKENGLMMTWTDNASGIFSNYVFNAFAFDMWLVGNDTIRKLVEDNYLNGFVVEMEEDCYVLLYDSTHPQDWTVRIETGGRSIFETGAMWKVSSNQQFQNYDAAECYYCPIYSTFLVNKEDLFITCVAPNQWNLTNADTLPSHNQLQWTLTLPAEASPLNVCSERFFLSGYARFELPRVNVHDDVPFVYLNSNVEESIEIDLRFSPYSGKIKLWAVKGEQTTAEYVMDFNGNVYDE